MNHQPPAPATARTAAASAVARARVAVAFRQPRNECLPAHGSHAGACHSQRPTSATSHRKALRWRRVHTLPPRDRSA